MHKQLLILDLGHNVTMALKVVLFDIDGTLIDTGGAGARSWAWAFQHLFGRSADIGEHSNAGMTDPNVARETFRQVMGRKPTGGELTRLLATYLSVLPDYVASSAGYRVLPGVERLLERLTEGGLLLGITTGALEAAAHAKLGRARLNHFFLVGGYGSDSDDRVALTRTAMRRAELLLGHSLAGGEVSVVGDTPLDIAAANGAGAVSVGVASGRYSPTALREAGADHVLGALTEPFPLLPES
ncbi:MAG TPA: HAD family hydrolase [Solirubrobacteraceae bacterium]